MRETASAPRYQTAYRCALAGSAIASSFFVPSSGLRKMVAFGQDRRRADCFRFGHGRQDMQRQFAAYFCSANNWRLGRAVAQRAFAFSPGLAAVGGLPCVCKRPGDTYANGVVPANTHFMGATPLA